MKRLLALLALALPLAAQNNPDDRIQKLVPLRYADPQTVANLLGIFPVDHRAETNLKVIALSGTRAHVTTAEDAIHELDVPSAAHKDVDLTVYFVIGSDENPAQTNNGAIPADLQSTVGTLKSTFPFKTYTLLDALSLHSRSGVGAEASGVLTHNRITQFKVRSATLEPDNMIRLDRLQAGLRTPIPTGDGKITYIDTGVTTDVVDVKEGQKLVVGRSSVDGPDRALFLVLIAKVVE